jgi:uncharacterized membrane protein
MKWLQGRLLGAMSMLLFTPPAMADSYRYMHVTIDTPWLIFLFLLVAVLMPFILMAILYWHNAIRRNAEEDAKGEK